MFVCKRGGQIVVVAWVFDLTVDRQIRVGSLDVVAPAAETVSAALLFWRARVADSAAGAASSPCKPP